MSSIPTSQARKVKAFDFRTFLLIAGGIGAVCYFSSVMGTGNFFKTLMATAHDLLLDTVFKIMAISVMAGAAASFMAEFGVVALLNWLLAPVVRIFWGLPGAASMGAVSTYLSDNPAILALAKDKSFIQYFHNYQRPALTNFGTSFGMGLILTVFMISQGQQFISAAIIGNVGAVIGSVVSTRIMLFFCKRELTDSDTQTFHKDNSDIFKYREIREGNVAQRAMNSLLDGGKAGVQLGLEIIPGVIVICTLVMLLINDASAGNSAAAYEGAKYEGVPLLIRLFEPIAPVIKALFGFSSTEAIAFPLTSLGATGATMPLVERWVGEGTINGNDIAVFTAMGMCWSGYLSTHVAMMDSLGFRKMTGKAIISHTFGGLAAGISAHQIYTIFG